MSNPAQRGGLLAALSHRAVLRAAAVAARAVSIGVPADPDALTALLYGANSIPCGRRAEADFDPRRIDSLLTRSTAELAGYRRHRGGYWQAWLNDTARTPQHPEPAHAHKVYVSPPPADLVPAVAAVARVALCHGAHSFKVGGTASGIHRPDKIVLYFDCPDVAESAARDLAARLVGLPVHGVPFTGQIGETGLVSRGFDQSGQSWRLLVCRLLGSAVARQAGRGHCGGSRNRPEAVTIAERSLTDAQAAGLDTRAFGPCELTESEVLVP